MSDSSSQRPLRALLLDLDGTLLDTHEMIYACFERTLGATVGRADCRETWERTMGLPLAEMFGELLREWGLEAPTPAELVRSYRARLLTMDHWVRPFPGVPEVLEELRAGGVRLAIVTNKQSHMARRHLALHDLERHFEVVVGHEHCRRGKPEPEPFLLALRQLGLSPVEAAGIGDSPHDITASRAAGLLAVGAMWGVTDRAAVDAAGPDLVLEAPGELLRLAMRSHCA